MWENIQIPGVKLIIFLLFKEQFMEEKKNWGTDFHLQLSITVCIHFAGKNLQKSMNIISPKFKVICSTFKVC